MHASGFAHCPASRFLVYSTVATAILVTATDTKFYFPLSINLHILEYRQWWRLFTWQLCYINSAEVLFAAMTFYQLRVIERLWGTRKFLSFLITTLPYNTLLPPLIVFLLRPLTLNMLGELYLPSGPTAIAFSILAQYHAMVPYLFRYRVSSSIASVSQPGGITEAKGIELTSKSWSYMLPAQLALTQIPFSLPQALVGWSVGYAWRLGILPGADWRWGGSSGGSDRNSSIAAAGLASTLSTTATHAAAGVARTPVTTSQSAPATAEPSLSSLQMAGSRNEARSQDPREGLSRIM